MDKKNILKKESVETVINSLKNSDIKEILVEGLFSSAKAFLLSSVIKKGVNLIILNNKEEASSCANDLYNLVDENKVFFLPTSKDASSRVQRTSTLGAVINYKKEIEEDDYIIIVSYIDSIEEDVIEKSSLINSIINIKKGDNLPFEFLKEVLYENSFIKEDYVAQPGDFAVRGGIIDIFSYSEDKPYRIEFFGNEIESIKKFDINTQRSIENVNTISIFPNISEKRENINYINFLDFIPSDSFVWFSNIDLPSLFYRESHKHIHLSPLIKNFSPDITVVFNTSPQPSFNKQFELLAEDIKSKRDRGYECYILSESENQIERLKQIFHSFNLCLKFENYTIQEGFIDNDNKICIYTDHQIFDRFRRVRIKRSIDKSERLTINELNSFNEGDYIVHIDHGIGRFGGLVKNNINGKIQEAIKLIYKDNDILFVSIHGLHKISKYKSGDLSSPKIYKLGTSSWEKLKNQTKSKVKDIAEDLIKLYAERRVTEGFAFSRDTYLQDELESSFIYEETPDQHKAIEAVKEDMEKNYPMDRLICGDVGFGKTEVAIRAAFKAVADNKQVAVLVPTTILSLQHYNTFKDRLKNFPCNIDFISRLRTNKELSSIISKLKEGTIDIIIGTHRLLNKEISFKDIGLLIIDEEQKFGVAAKERLRQLKLSVDTLTLSATPIPRTLQFSLLGARDLSIITTPPPNRLPIQTEIIDFNEERMKEIIDYELERNGQLFFVHNRVEDILSIEAIIKKLRPNAKTCVAHGQMDPKVLENKILDYMAGDYDILIATTIIENGIDIPNTNTIIINQAQNFGLSDLHQLRGRVGRSNRKAFCYLIVPSMKSISDDARRRLKAIEAFSDLGSGFNIAMQDLDIRGMGNMLGAQQSGYIAEMGFETYQRILEEAFEEIKISHTSISKDNIEENNVYVSDCSIDTDMQLLIPDEYINITAEKIRIYKELDNISDEEQLNKFITGIEDRFGPIPEEVRQLCFVVRLRKAAQERGFEKIVMKNEKLVLYFINNQMSPYYKTKRFAEIIKYIQSKGNRYQIKETNNKLYITIQDVRTMEGAYTVIQKM